MNRKAFLLGFLSTGSQILLLQEMIVAFKGDEIFIGIALFGWLLWASIGAFLSGRFKTKISSSALLFLASMILPPVIILTRISPWLVVDNIGEIIPFIQASFLSVILMMPTALFAGLLFTKISYEADEPSESITRVYLWEGIGAFLSGIILLLTVGSFFSGLEVSILIALFIIFAVQNKYKIIYRGIVGTVFILIALFFIRNPAQLDLVIERYNYQPYDVIRTFDTHYGRQTILLRDSTHTLLTDNQIESCYPDLEAAENLLLPPILYKPDAKDILFVGRTELGIVQIAKQLSDISITALDPRKILSSKLEETGFNSEGITKLETDPIKFFKSNNNNLKYDIIILNTGSFDCYRNSRFITAAFLNNVKQFLNSGGIVYIPLNYDTDRFISRESSNILAVIYNVFNNSFEHTIIWPGSSTLLFASDSDSFKTPYDSLTANLSSFSYSPYYINDNYLFDRWDSFKTERLYSSVQSSDRINSIIKPLLPYYQSLYRSRTNSLDYKLLSFLLENPNWLISLPILLIVIIIILLVAPYKNIKSALLLYFNAGFISISFELIIFYIYQNFAGSLYSEIAILIGTFMFGLAGGTYLSRKGYLPQSPLVPLITLLITITIFILSFNSIPNAFVTLYFLLLIFVTGLATGSLFVSATDLLYKHSPVRNRGAGYAFELFGSALAGLFTMTFLLPVIGLYSLSIAMVILLGLTVVIIKIYK